MKIKHIPKHMKIPLIKNSRWGRSHMVFKLLMKGYTLPDKYLGGK